MESRYSEAKFSLRFLEEELLHDFSSFWWYPALLGVSWLVDALLQPLFPSVWLCPNFPLPVKIRTHLNYNSKTLFPYNVTLQVLGKHQLGGYHSTHSTVSLTLYKHNTLSCQRVCSLPHFLDLSSFICTLLFKALFIFTVPNMFPFTLSYNHPNCFFPDDEWPVCCWFQWSVLNLYLFDSWWHLIFFLIHFLYLASKTLMYLDFSQITLDASSQGLNSIFQ